MDENFKVRLRQARAILPDHDPPPASVENISDVSVVVFGTRQVLPTDVEEGECVWTLAEFMAETQGPRWRLEMMDNQAMRGWWESSLLAQQKAIARWLQEGPFETEAPAPMI